MFDLETNGLGRHYNDIIEIFAMVTDANGTASPNSFYSKCKPMRGVGFLEKIHGISNDMLKNEKLFDVVGQKLMD